MVKSRDQIERIAHAYAERLRGDYRVTQVILFGSYAQGTATEYSDIDLAVVSPDFRGRPEMEVLEDLSRRTLGIDTSLEVVAFTPEQLVSPDPRSFCYQVKAKGIPLAA